MCVKFFPILLALFVAISPAWAAESSFVPGRLDASIGGFLGPTYQVKLHGRSLTCTKFADGHRHPKSVIVTPTKSQWLEFRRTLDELKIWRWRASYPNPNVSDGTQWSLNIAYADHALKTHGDNSYPDDSGQPNNRPKTTETFQRYLAAIEKLTGGKTFQ